jgi:hypothetical protein
MLHLGPSPCLTELYYWPAGSSWEWNEATDKNIASIDTSSMHFANREDSVQKLVAVHQSNYYRAKEGSGEQCTIPLCDHVVGLGKTEFGRQYIRICRKIWDCATRTDFQEALCNCHTIRVVLPYESLIKAASMESEVLMRLVWALQKSFRIAPQCLAEECVSSEHLLVTLTRVVGPLFIVLDEIGDAFMSREHSVRKQREKFLHFCQEVLGSWSNPESVFFLLIGRGSFFSYVGRRPEIFSETKISPVKFKFERLPPRFLKPEAIGQILNQTRCIQTEEHWQTVAENFGLTKENFDEDVNRLFSETNGHPRQLLSVLKTSKSSEDLLNCIVPHEIECWDQFCGGVLHYKYTILSLLACMTEGKQKDLSEVVTVQGKSISLDEIAASAYIAWDGNIHQATLYAQPSVLSFLTSYVAPFEKIIQALQLCPEQIPLDFADAFELMLMKRFQQMFSTERSPREISKYFFDTAKFGGCERVSLPEKYFRMAKITTRGSKSATLGSKYADPSCWPRLMQAIDSYDSVCLKPAPQSSSPDVLFSTRAWQDATNIRLNENFHCSKQLWQHRNE